MLDNKENQSFVPDDAVDEQVPHTVEESGVTEQSPEVQADMDSTEPAVEPTADNAERPGYDAMDDSDGAHAEDEVPEGSGMAEPVGDEETAADEASDAAEDAAEAGAPEEAGLDNPEAEAPGDDGTVEDNTAENVEPEADVDDTADEEVNNDNEKAEPEEDAEDAGNEEDFAAEDGTEGDAQDETPDEADAAEDDEAESDAAEGEAADESDAENAEDESEEAEGEPEAEDAEEVDSDALESVSDGSDDDDDELPPEEPKKVRDSIREEDYARFGVDPVHDRKKKKVKGPSVFELMNPKNLQTSVEKYGFSFSAKNYYLFMLAAFAVAIATGWLFQLNWVYIGIIALVALLATPFVFLASLKGMYEAKQFHDASDYMEQLLYSFRRKKKILPSLEDVYDTFEDDKGPMKDLAQEAIEYIRTADTDGDIHREALDIIEKQYSNDRIRSIHNFLIAVENNGGKIENPTDLLLDERAKWDERIHVFQTEKNTIKRNVIISIVFSLLLCFGILYILSVDTLEQLHIPQNLFVQTTSLAVILVNLLLFVKINNKFTQSWLLQESKQSDYQALRDYFYVENYDPAKQKKLAIIWTACTSLIWIAGILMDNMIIIALGALISLFCAFSSTISYKLAKKSTTKEIQKAFPQWMMELALLLQMDNVQVAISKTLETAPAVLRPELELLVEKFEESPHSLKPYTEFLEKYDLAEVRSAMKMLYSVSASGTVDIDEQITDLIKKQNALMDKAEKIRFGDQLAGLTSINMLPMLFCILKSVADMTILVFSLFQLMSF